MTKMRDVIVVGGGPAGLSAALLLARCLRDVAIVDDGQGRNRFARHTHGYLTRDGVSPEEFLAHCRKDLRRYPVVNIADRVEHASRRSDGVFDVALASGERLASRKLLLATGVRDAFPRLTEFESFYGRSVHHCPYCDGYEHRGTRLAAYGIGNAAVGLALALRTWSARVVACADGTKPDTKHMELARTNAIDVQTQIVIGLEGANGQLSRVRLADGSCIECEAMFFNTGQTQRSDLPRRLGCRFASDGGVEVSDRQCTSVPGLFVAGDADKEVQFLIVAAAQGATAAVGINRELQDEDTGTAATHAPHDLFALDR